MRKGNLETAAEMIDQAADAVAVIAAKGVTVAMNRFNSRATPADADEEDDGNEKDEGDIGGEA